MAEFGRLTAVFDADTRKFEAGAKGVAAKVLALESNFKGLTGGATSAIGAVSGLAGPLAIAGGAAIAAASAIGGVAAGLFELVKSSAKAGGELFDLSQKTSFAVETLSGLSIVAKTTGTDIQALSGSLIIFQKNMGAAQDATSKQGELFKSLNIDTRDNEKALRQAVTVLAKYGDTQKGVEIATKLFGRSGAAVLAIVKETNGNLDEAIKKYKELGLVIGKDAAQASDKFNDLLEETTLQLEAVTRSIGMELLPVATDALVSISENLKKNKDQWISWGTSIANVLRGLSVVVHSELGMMLGQLADFSIRWLTIPGLAAQGLNALGSTPSVPGGPTSMLTMMNRLSGGIRPPSLRGINPFKARISAPSGGGGSGGGGGGGGRGGGGGGSSDAAEIIFKELGGGSVYGKIVLGLTRERTIIEGQLQEMNRRVQEFADLVAQSGGRRRSMADITGLDYFDLGGGSAFGTLEASGTRKRSMADGASRPRIATAAEQGNRDRIAKMRDQLRDLGHQLTSIFSDSIEAGFSKGVKAGLATMAQGLIQVLEQSFLRRLAEGLGDMLGNVGTGSGGGFWKGLFRTVLGAAIGGAAGGIGGGGGGGGGAAGSSAAGAFAGKFADGGYIAPGQWGIAGDGGRPEVVFGGRAGATVFGRKNSGQVVNNYSINLPPDRGGNYSSPKSRRQLARDMMAAIQGANA